MVWSGVLLLMLHFVSDFEKVLSHKVHFHTESTLSLVESICSPKIPVCGLHMESTLYWDYGRMVVGLYVDYMWTPGGLQVDSTWTPWTLRCYRCTNTWTPPGIQVYSSKTPWMLPGVHLESRWSPPQPVARYNNLRLGGALFKIVDRLSIAHRTCKLILLGFSQFMADLYYIRLVTSLAIMHQITTV